MDEIRIYDISSLIINIKKGYQPTYLFFWGHQARKDGQIGKQCLCQWWRAEFKVDNIAYPTAEHYLMAEKARMFGDGDTLSKILQTSQPGEAKKLGRNVRWN
jgi:ribA/ribD-fused uncharacterized protein